MALHDLIKIREIMGDNYIKQLDEMYIRHIEKYGHPLRTIVGTEIKSLEQECERQKNNSDE